jgi:hypothetical protein
MRCRTLSVVALLIAVVLVGAAPAALRAQDEKTAAAPVITGVVNDSAGQPAVGVVITIVREGERVEQRSLTDSTGRFTFAELGPGRYLVAATFGSGSVTAAVEVPSSGARDLRLELRPGFSDAIVVTATRGAESLAAIPASVTVVPEEEVRRQSIGVRDLAEVLAAGRPRLRPVQRKHQHTNATWAQHSVAHRRRTTVDVAECRTRPHHDHAANDRAH